MKEQFEITLTLTNNTDDELDLNIKAGLVGDIRPSLYFAVACKTFKKLIISDLETKLELSDQVAQLLKRAAECSCADEDD
ncbi:hypothetical protein ACP179_20730 [Xenorhabdus stockiae]|uniref:hypothetical protein n=1 Tax=Xenorhabdus stockiae TaxID=351614 RepID=UPI003CF103F3